MNQTNQSETSNNKASFDTEEETMNQTKFDTELVIAELKRLQSRMARKALESLNKPKE